MATKAKIKKKHIQKKSSEVLTLIKKTHTDVPCKSLFQNCTSGFVLPNKLTTRVDTEKNNNFILLNNGPKFTFYTLFLSMCRVFFEIGQLTRVNG